MLINLRSCKFYSISSSSRLKRVIRQLKILPQLELFQIIQPHSISLSDLFKRKFNKAILKHKLSNFRMIDLVFRYDYHYLTNVISTGWPISNRTKYFPNFFLIHYGLGLIFIPHIPYNPLYHFFGKR
jgi:hypothetical protein